MCCGNVDESIMKNFEHKLLVQVTQNDINHGQRKNCGYCPIALAVKRTIKFSENEELRLLVYLSSIEFNNAYDSHCTISRSNNSKKVQNFIKNFDNGRNVEPFSFFLTINNIVKDFIDGKADLTGEPI